MRKIIYLAALFFIISSSNAQNSEFYYYKGEKQFLQKVIDEKFILYESSIDTNELKTVMNISKLKFKNQGIIHDYPNIQKLSTE